MTEQTGRRRATAVRAGSPLRSAQAPLRGDEQKPPAGGELDPTEEVGAVRPSTGRPHNLPAHVSSFVGREQELAEVASLLGTTRLLTLSGPPGVGKTRLAVQVADQVVADYDETWMVELAPLPGPELLPSAVASVVGVREDPNQPLADAVASRLDGGRVLLLLDNCEHLVHGCASLAQALLKACSGLTILTTSQEPLGLVGEVVLRVPGLSLPESHDPETVEGSEAVELFFERASAAQPGLVLDGELVSALVEICRRLDGVPLAIELAAAQVSFLSPVEIARRLGDHFHLLARDTPDDCRHRSLEAAVDWGHALCSEPERILLRRLAVFAGGFTLEAVEEVCAGEALDRGQVGQLLGGLVNKSLVAADTSRSETRYRLLEIIRQYASERLAEAGESTLIRTEHARWCTDLAEQAEVRLATLGQRSWRRRLHEERDNLRTAMDCAVSAGHADLALRLSGALALHWRLSGELSKGRQRLESALSLPGGSPSGRAKAHWGVGLMAAMLGDFAAALSQGQAALAIAHQVGDEPIAARALNLLGMATMFHHSPADAMDYLEQSVHLARQSEDAWCLTDSLARQGQGHMLKRDQVAARACFEDCLHIARLHQDGASMASALIGLGWVAVEEDHDKRAERLFEQARESCVDVGTRYEMAEMLCFLGDVSRRRQDYAKAAEVLQQGLALARDIGSSVLLARYLGAVARLAQAQGDAATACRFGEEAVSVARQAGVPYILLRCLFALGTASVVTGDLAGARLRFEEVQSLAKESGDLDAEALACLRLGDVAAREGNDDEAASLCDTSLRWFDRVGDSAHVATCLEALAGTAASGADHARAARLLGAAHSLRKQSATAEERSAEEQLQYERWVTRCREGLGQEEFDDAWAKGAALSRAQAVAFATRRRGSRRGRSVTGWDSLTPAQREVAALVPDGLTSAQIGERLFMAPRTVENHLHRIYTKLGVSTRAELAREAARHTD